MATADEKGVTGKTEEVGSNASSPSFNASSGQQKPSFGSRVKAHFKKWWWLHLIIFIIVLLIIVLPVVFVAYPHTAQRDIDRSTLDLTSVQLTDPTPNSFHFKQNATVGNKSKYHPHLDSFNASLSLDNQSPFAYVKLPAINAEETALSLVDQDVPITNLASYTAFTTAFIASETVTIQVKGRTGLKQGSLHKTTVDYSKHVTLAALNKLAGFNISSFSIKLSPEADGTNMLGEVSIPNPSIFTIAMGNVTFLNFLPATASTPRTEIGTASLADFTLVPGLNKVPMRSKINQTAVITALQTTYKDGVMPVEIVGDSAVYDGQHLPYYENALKGFSKEVKLDVGAALKETGVDLKVLAGATGGGAPPPS